MQKQIDTAFAALNAQLIESDQQWVTHKLATKAAAVEAAKAAFADGSNRHTVYYRNGSRHFDTTLALSDHFGSKGMCNLLIGRVLIDALEVMLKNTKAGIAKRDATIIKALTKAGVTEIPDFTLSHTGDGYEGYFTVADKVVTIRTILAGGYNIQRLHQRTLVKVK